MKKIVQKGNRQLTVSDEQLDTYLNMGYAEVDEKTGKLIQKDPVSKEAALKKAAEDGENLTDDCAAVERMGMKVSLTAGSRENLKLTTPFDLIVAEGILEARGKGVL